MYILRIFIFKSQVKSLTLFEFTLDLVYQEIFDTDDCVNNLCAEGSTCVDLRFSYTCQCPYGNGGRYCEGTRSSVGSTLQKFYLYLLKVIISKVIWEILRNIH